MINDGNIVKLRNKEKFMYVDGGFYSIINFEISHTIGNYNLQTLTRIDGNRDLDIVEICESDISCDEIIWKGNVVRWENVPMGTLIRGRDFEEDHWKSGKFVSYTDNSDFPYQILLDGKLNFVAKYKMCEIVEELPKVLPLVKSDDVIRLAKEYCDFTDCTKYNGDCAECMATYLSKKFEIRG